MKIEIKNVKGTGGREGAGYRCALYVDGRHVADVADWGDGGSANFYPPKSRGGGFAWEGEELVKKVRAYVATFPPDPLRADAEEWERREYPNGHGYDGPEGLECYIAKLVDAELDTRRMKRLCKTRIVAELADGRTIYWKMPYSPESAAKIRAKHPDLVKILNEVA